MSPNAAVAVQLAAMPHVSSLPALDALVMDVVSTGVLAPREVAVEVFSRIPSNDALALLEALLPGHVQLVMSRHRAEIRQAKPSPTASQQVRNNWYNRSKAELTIYTPTGHKFFIECNYDDLMTASRDMGARAATLSQHSVWLAEGAALLKVHRVGTVKGLPKGVLAAHLQAMP